MPIVPYVEEAGPTKIGNIRLGAKAVNKAGKEYPIKLQTFRFTSADREAMDEISHWFGGEVKEWNSPDGPEWEVVTESKEMDVRVPPGGFSQYMEAWNKGVLTHRCDGVKDLETGEACGCGLSKANRDVHNAKPVTRLNVNIPCINVQGSWLLTTGSEYAAREFASLQATFDQAQEDGMEVSGRLALTQKSKRSAQGTQKWGQVSFRVSGMGPVDLHNDKGDTREYPDMRETALHEQGTVDPEDPFGIEGESEGAELVFGTTQPKPSQAQWNTCYKYLKMFGITDDAFDRRLESGYNCTRDTLTEATMDLVIAALKERHEAVS